MKSHGNIVEADDTDISRDVISVLLQRSDDADCDEIAGAKQNLRQDDSVLQDGGKIAIAAVDLVQTQALTDKHPLFLVGQAIILQPLFVSVEAIP